MTLDIQTIFKQIENDVRVKLKEIHPDLDITIKYPFIIIYAPADAIIDVMKKELKVEDSQYVTLTRISWDIDGIRLYLKVKGGETEVVT